MPNSNHQKVLRIVEKEESQSSTYFIRNDAKCLQKCGDDSKANGSNVIENKQKIFWGQWSALEVER